MSRPRPLPMRTLSLSFLMVFVTLACGVFEHHLMTTGHEKAALVPPALGAALSFVIGYSAVAAAKKEKRRTIRILAALVLLLISGACFDSFFRSDFILSALYRSDPILSVAHKSVLLVAGWVPALFGIVILFLSGKNPNQQSQPSHSASG